MKTVTAAFAAAMMLAGVSVSTAEVRTEVVEYRHGSAVLEGYMAYDDSVKGKRPGVLVVHEWMGHNPYVRMRADKLARLGYAAFALDMYGKGVRAKDSKEAASLAGIYKGDRGLMRARAQAGLDVLAKHPMVDPTRMAAIGYCFGGTAVLELARAGASLAAVVSFHGGLDTPSAEDARNIRGKVLVLHGGDDPFVPPAQVASFQEEMRKAGVDWQFVAYGGAVHSFTNPEAGGDNSKGAAYNEKADRRSWESMKAFLSESLK